MFFLVPSAVDAGDGTWWVVCLPSVRQALGSIPSTMSNLVLCCMLVSTVLGNWRQEEWEFKVIFSVLASFLLL